MTAQTPAMRRVGIRPIVERLRRARRRSGPPDDRLLVHVHARPRVVARTTEGDVALDLVGACLYGEALVLRFAWRTPVAATVESFTARFGDEDKTFGDPISVAAGDAISFTWALVWTEMEAAAEEMP